MANSSAVRTEEEVSLSGSCHSNLLMLLNGFLIGGGMLLTSPSSLLGAEEKERDDCNDVGVLVDVKLEVVLPWPWWMPEAAEEVEATRRRRNNEEAAEEQERRTDIIICFYCALVDDDYCHHIYQRLVNEERFDELFPWSMNSSTKFLGTFCVKRKRREELCKTGSLLQMDFLEILNAPKIRKGLSMYGDPLPNGQN